MYESRLIGHHLNSKDQPLWAPDLPLEGGLVRCIHGANECNLPIAGKTVAWVRENLRSALNLSYWAEAIIDGSPVGNGHVLDAGECLEFLLRAGFKGGKGRSETRKAEGLLRSYPELLRIAEEVKALGVDPEAAVDETLARVASWAEERFGPVPHSEAPILATLCERLSRIETNLEVLIRQRTVRDSYTTKELAEILGKKEFTVREWCRLGRIHASKLPGGRGNEGEWRISHEELVRYQNESLLPLRRKY